MREKGRERKIGKVWAAIGASASAFCPRLVFEAIKMHNKLTQFHIYICFNRVHFPQHTHTHNIDTTREIKTQTDQPQKIYIETNSAKYTM